MDKRVFLAVSLCAAIFLLWNQFYLKPYTERQQAYLQQQQAQQQVAPSAQGTPAQGSTGAKASGAPTASIGKPAAKAVEAQSLQIGPAGYTVLLNTRGGTVSEVKMADFRGQKTDKINRLISAPDGLELSSPSPDWSYLSNVIYTVAKKDAAAATLTYDDANVSIVRTYSVDPELFSVTHETTLKFKKPGPNYIFVGLRALKSLPKSEMENERRQIFLNRVGNQHSWTVSDIDEPKEDQGQANWMGFSSRYFLSALVNRSTTEHPQFQARPIGTDEVTAGFYYPVQGSQAVVPVTMYLGPKDVDVLKKVGGHLDTAVDFGWFTIFAYPMLKALKWFNSFLHNFGLAIILLTVLVKLLTYPLTLKSMRSMKQMQRIQPQLAKLRERYKDDKERLNREMLQLMKANGYNPMSGCLPMFIQMPIFIALYNVLYGAIDLFGQPFFGWIHDLSAKDPFFVTPVLLALMMFVQQRMTPNTATDPAQQRMMMMMPVIFGFMMLWLPSGLTLYMLVNSVVSVVQQLVINRSLNVGTAAA